MRKRIAASRQIRGGRRLRVASLLMTIAVGSVLFISPAAAQAPPGNNGFIKVDGEELDDIPNNDPHVGCTFLVEFYNYEEGPLEAEVTFEGIAPTGGGVLLTDTVFIGEDPAGGGNDLDAAEEYTLDFTGIEPHPQQGFHVRLTIHADGSQGADVKHKVFWVEQCAQPSPSPSPSPSTSPSPTSPPATNSSSPPTVAPPSGGVETGGGTDPGSTVPTLIGLFLLVTSLVLWRLRSSRT